MSVANAYGFSGGECCIPHTIALSSAFIYGCWEKEWFQITAPPLMLRGRAPILPAAWRLPAGSRLLAQQQDNRGGKNHREDNCAKSRFFHDVRFHTATHTVDKMRFWH